MKVSVIYCLIVSVATPSLLLAEVYHPTWWAVPVNQPQSSAAIVGGNSSPLVEGQLKFLCKRALDTITEYQSARGVVANDPHLARLTALVSNRKLNTRDPVEGNKLAVMTQGQLKNAVQPFLDYLADIGYAQSRLYPWPETGQNNLAVAQVGMAKHLFSFDLTRDSDEDDFPDWWEALYFGAGAVTTPATAANDADGDSTSDCDEYATNTDPTTGVVTQKMINARFLNQATFGASDVSIESYPEVINRSTWVDDQLTKPASVFAPPDYLFAYRDRSKAASSFVDYNPLTPAMDYHPDSKPMPSTSNFATPPSYSSHEKYGNNQDMRWYEYVAGEGIVRRYQESTPTIDSGYLALEFVEVDFNSLLVHHGISGKDQLRQRMAFALSQLFVVSFADAKLTKYGSAYGMADYYNKLNQMAFGRVANITKMVARHPVMGVYLNSSWSNGSMPNENFARELLQLFTIGTTKYNQNGSYLISNGSPASVYTEQDVKAMAKVFSGYKMNDFSFIYENSFMPFYRRGWVTPMTRDYFPYVGNVQLSSELGSQLNMPTVTCSSDSTMHPGEAVIEALSEHPNASVLFSLHLIRSFVKSNPSPDYVKEIARVFTANKADQYQLGKTIKAILTHPEAEAWPMNRSLSGLVREPFVKFIHAARALGFGAQGSANSGNNTWVNFPIPWDPSMGAVKNGSIYQYPADVLTNPNRDPTVFTKNSNRAIKGHGVFGETTYTGSEATSFARVTGQWPLYSPSVFNFYRPDHIPVEWSSTEKRAYSPAMQIYTANRTLGTYDQTAMGLYGNFLGGTSWNAGHLLHPLNSPIERWRSSLPSNDPKPSLDTVVSRMSETLTGGRFKLGTGPSARILRDKFSATNAAFSSVYTTNSEPSRRCVDAAAAFLVLASPEFSVLE